MKQNILLPLARVASSLALLSILVCFHMVLTLTHFLPPDGNTIMDPVYAFFFIGTVLGVVLCPLFLPVPRGKSKPLVMGISFIVFLLVVELTLRSLGVAVWLGSVTVRSIMAMPEGIMFTMAFGLFYLVWLKKPPAVPTPEGVVVPLKPMLFINKATGTSRLCLPVFGVILIGSVLVRYYSVPGLEQWLVAADPVNGAAAALAFSFSCITWGVLVAGLSAAASVFLLQQATAAGKNLLLGGEPAGRAHAGEGSPSEGSGGKPVTNWRVIVSLVGLATVFTILNGILNMPIFSLYSGETIYHPHFLTVAVVVPVLSVLAGFSISRFIRWFLPPAIILFIVISCLPLFKEDHWFNVIMSTLVAIAHYTLWVVFTTAVVEHYAGSFWFYGMAIVIFLSSAFAFLASVINSYVPDGDEYRVLFIVLAAVLFMLLSLRLLFPKLPPFLVMPHPEGAKKHHFPPREPFPASSSFDDIFREYGLSQREIEVASLLVQHGLSREDIAASLCISPGTIKIHISKIYNKFAVNTRAEFMSLFVNK